MADSSDTSDLFPSAATQTSAAAQTRAVEVLVPVALDKAYSYRLPQGMELNPGDFVTVGLGARETVGIVWDSDPDAPVSSGGNLKPVISRHDWPPLSAKMRQLVDWIASYTLASKGMVLKMAIRDPSQASASKPRYGIRLTGQQPDKITPARGRVILAAQGGFAHPKSELAKSAGVSTGVIDALVDAGVMEAVPLPPTVIAPRPEPEFAITDLNQSQREAADILAIKVAAKNFSVSLLEGITGSGKTEVYFEAIAQALREDKQSLVLMPEIALTAQFLARFEARFGVRPAEWHSTISPNKKDLLWQAIATGDAKVVIGARSALFLPFHQLGLIVIDEEHEQAYKQDDGVHYHARDMAVVRGRIEGCAVVLASATPSIESKVNAGLGRYTHVLLTERFGGRTLPQITAIDMRRHPLSPGTWISTPLKQAIAETIAAGDQALLFLNRRGYAPLTLCRHCGHRWQCKQCSAWLVEHRFRKSLVCHHCGYIERTPQSCEACHTPNSLTVCGPGVERLAEEVAAIFPDVRSIVLSSDFPGGTERLRRELDAVAAGEFQLIIGTQLVAKGHNFPGLALVGVVDADVGLMSGDPRAAERTFQLLQQVTGRAGRGKVAGRGLVQTHDPSHPVMKAILSGNAEQFYMEEIAMRRAANLSPFGRMAGIIVSGTDKIETESHARTLARVAHGIFSNLSEDDGNRWGGLSMLGPAEAPIALIRGRYRFRLLSRGPRDADLQGFLRSVLANAPKAKGNIRVTVDIDPVNFS
jgi:primosomal protein N' (replication factor Y) (superfamily II helicase)